MFFRVTQANVGIRRTEAQKRASKNASVAVGGEGFRFVNEFLHGNRRLDNRLRHGDFAHGNDACHEMGL